jgi:hypothetical protein
LGIHADLGDYADLERVLVDVGAVRLGDQRLRRKDEEEETSAGKIRRGNAPSKEDEDDSDWD